MYLNLYIDIRTSSSPGITANGEGERERLRSFSTLGISVVTTLTEETDTDGVLVVELDDDIEDTEETAVDVGDEPPPMRDAIRIAVVFLRDNPEPMNMLSSSS